MKPYLVTENCSHKKLLVMTVIIMQWLQFHLDGNIASYFLVHSGILGIVLYMYNMYKCEDYVKS